MKTKLFALMMLAATAFVSCEEKASDEFCDNPDATCPNDVPIDATSCCTDQDCYWTYNSNKYPCVGDDCSDALNEIIADACSAGTILKSGNASLEELKAELQAFTDKLLIEARAASGCN